MQSAAHATGDGAHAYELYMCTRHVFCSLPLRPCCKNAANGGRASEREAPRRNGNAEIRCATPFGGEEYFAPIARRECIVIPRIMCLPSLSGSFSQALLASPSPSCSFLSAARDSDHDAAPNSCLPRAPVCERRSATWILLAAHTSLPSLHERNCKPEIAQILSFASLVGRKPHFLRRQRKSKMDERRASVSLRCSRLHVVSRLLALGAPFSADKPEFHTNHCRLIAATLFPRRTADTNPPLALEQCAFVLCFFFQYFSSLFQAHSANKRNDLASPADGVSTGRISQRVSGEQCAQNATKRRKVSRKTERNGETVCQEMRV